MRAVSVVQQILAPAATWEPSNPYRVNQPNQVSDGAIGATTLAAVSPTSNVPFIYRERELFTERSVSVNRFRTAVGRPKLRRQFSDFGSESGRTRPPKSDPKSLPLRRGFGVEHEGKPSLVVLGASFVYRSHHHPYRFRCRTVPKKPPRTPTIASQGARLTAGRTIIGKCVC